VQLLLRGGADVNLPMHDGATPLLISANKGHRDVVRILLLVGADQAAQCQGSTALQWAERQGHAAVAALLRNPPAPPPSPAGGSAAPVGGGLGAPPAAAAPKPSVKSLADFAAAVPDIDDVSELLRYSAAQMAQVLEQYSAVLKDGTKVPGQAQRQDLLAEHAAATGAAPEPAPAPAPPPALAQLLAELEGAGQLPQQLQATRAMLLGMGQDTSSIDADIAAVTERIAQAEAGAAAPAQAGLLPKYVAAENQIRVGKAADATHGIQVLMGLTDHALSQFYADPIGAIRKEFALSGSADDKENLRCVLSGIQRAGWASGESLDVLVAHPHARLAKLKKQHVLCLRLYTTTSFCRVNDPLRQVPPQRPHPFAATTFFIDQGIKLMRAVAASLPDAHTTRIFWRGLKDLGLTMEFLQKGGTEFACLSTSASKDVAVNFAVSELPLIFKFETTDFTSRGADIAFLSVYPGEQEALYPPLTYLRSVKTETEDVGGKSMLVATVQPVFM